MNDDLYMEQALQLARKGQGFTSPNPMVGAVLVKHNRIVGQGYHQFAGGPHAEVNAIDDAGTAARNATLYVTLEPCNHHGRTPPCTEKIIAAGITRVVVAISDPNPDVAGGGIAYLREHGIAVTTGVCRPQALALNEFFVKYVRTKRPFVILKCAATLDGYIAARTGDSKWVTGPVARNHVHRLRQSVDAIMVGIGTIMADDPQLTTRLDDRGTTDPLRIILDTYLSIPKRARVLNLNSDSDTLIVCSDKAPSERIAQAQDCGAQVMVLPQHRSRLSLDELMDRLGAREVTSLLIEGGSKVIGSALAERVVDKINFFYAPKILGGGGIPICSGTGPDSMKESLPLKMMSVDKLGDDILVEGYLGTPLEEGECLPGS
jgi:diaminohydroxyphosphoribosylaminopyrimidine deaminase/5-amino-6-(5-phosphoribosylamino)uracil reductase